jgi:two-component sensor histidine kinase/PAS domain-containing protein
LTDPLAFLAGGGEASRMIRERDWTGHPLGPPERWTPEFKAALSLVLNSPESMILAWGPDLSFFFNETYFPLLGPRLPWAMGERFDKVWADGWSQAKPIIDAAFAGRPERFTDLPWTLDEDRGARDTWWTFSYSRVLDARGDVAGLFIFTNETTARVLGERQLSTSQADARENAERIKLALAAGAIIGTWFWDLPNDRFTVDEAFASAFGLDPALGRVGLSLEQVVETVHPDDKDGLIAAIDAAIGRGGQYAHEYRVRRTDGRYYWIEANGRVERAADGTPLRFPGVLIDKEERRAEESRRGALLELGDRLRELEDVDAIAFASAEIIARTLGAVRAGFGIVDEATETVVIQPDWRLPSVQSIAGPHRFRDYGSFIEDLKRGQTVVVADVAADPRTADNADALLAIGIRVLVNLPIMDRGRLASVLFIHYAQPHAFSQAELRFVQAVGDRTQAAIARRQAQHQQQLLNEELSHRLKNTLTLVQAIADQTLRTIQDREPVEAFVKRLHTLGAAHEVLTRQNWQAAPMFSVVAATLQSFGPFERFDVSGPEVKLGPRTALSLSLLLHELATNALKYGSLSNDSGRVSLTWHVAPTAGQPVFVLRWRETGGPPTREPARRGFGSRLIRSGLVGTGGVELRYAAAGFEADMTAPLAHVQEA